MFPRVTAILVAHNGAERLPGTLDALAAQSRRPDALIIVDAASTDGSSELIATAGASHVISTSESLSFGEALEAAVRLTPPPTSDDELLWFLSHDSAPEPEALARLVGALEIAPSVAVAGPKLVQWGRTDFIDELGQSITRLGATVELVHDELDQAQHDTLSDVLGVAPAGLLVRHRVWDELGGFDPALPVVDDALDFSIRTRLSGHRVQVVPEARVAFASEGVAGPAAALTARARRTRTRQSRTAQLHRRLAYAPGAVVALHWLTLLPLAILRSVWHLLTKSPGSILGEFGAAFRVAFSGMRVSQARSSIARTRKLGWASIAALRVAPDEMRRRRALEREARIAWARGSRDDVRFISSGGAWTLLGATVAGVILFLPLLGSAGISGGALLPLSATPAELWANIGYGWRDIGTGFVGAADPFAAVLAILGSLTFWTPSLALLIVWVAAIPVSALGAWFAAARLTESGGVRAVAGIAWAIAPPLLVALSDGRPTAVLAHVLLPWLFFALLGARRSWAASATASLLFAAIVASAPSLAPALLVIWLLCVAASGRRFARYIALPVPAAALAAALVWAQLERGTPLALLADPGAPFASVHDSVVDLLLGFPARGFGGWTDTLAWLSLGGIDARYIVLGLVAPLVILAVIGLFVRGSRTAVFALAVALLGFATAFAATHVEVATLGSTSLALWSGAGQSLYWLGLLGAAIVALRAFGRFAVAPGAVLALALVLVAAPAATATLAGRADVQPAAERELPAFVVAEAQADPRVTTLVVTPQSDGAVLAELQRGSGVTLDDQSTYEQTRPEPSERERALADLTGNLVSRSGVDTSAALTDFGVSFVLLATGVRESDGSISGATQLAADRATVALDGNASLVPVGETDFGMLWRFGEAGADVPATQIPADAGGWRGNLITILLIVVFGATLLLSIPTGVGREYKAPVRERPVRLRPKREPRPEREPKPRRERRSRAKAAPEPVGTDDTSADESTAADAVDEPEYPPTPVELPPAEDAADLPVAATPASEDEASLTDSAPTADSASDDAADQATNDEEKRDG
ncbi:glycosyltransferase family 2 protein [Agromyces atrinae]|uniref:glycosyltransferase family 2 protein n=1 Tax=Agromyces atrinae TaxID=592376 RepID=UPI001F58AFCD|nr:glycosyltransferase family 2 protein [Agromyces atrinae]MCI2958038.1 glycosyltransferase family 2 protein [Agromyces atrinae]